MNDNLGNRMWDFIYEHDRNPNAEEWHKFIILELARLGLAIKERAKLKEGDAISVLLADFIRNSVDEALKDRIGGDVSYLASVEDGKLNNPVVL